MKFWKIQKFKIFVETCFYGFFNYTADWIVKGGCLHALACISKLFGAKRKKTFFRYTTFELINKLEVTICIVLIYSLSLHASLWGSWTVTLRLTKNTTTLLWLGHVVFLQPFIGPYLDLTSPDCNPFAYSLRLASRQFLSKAGTIKCCKENLKSSWSKECHKIPLLVWHITNKCAICFSGHWQNRW